MKESIEILVPAFAVGVFALYLLSWQSREGKASGAPTMDALDDFRPTHYQYFAVVRHALSTVDDEYLRQRVSPAVAAAALRERRAVARKFLVGLHDDFVKLNQLARMIASLSPALDRAQETERLKLTLKFQLLYALVWMLLQTGNIPLRNFEHLSVLIGRFADRMDQAMASVNTLSGEPLGMGSQL